MRALPLVLLALASPAAAQLDLDLGYDRDLRHRTDVLSDGRFPNTDVGELWLRYDGVVESTFVVGRHRIVRHGGCYVGNTPWRQFERAYDAVSVEFGAFADVPHPRPRRIAGGPSSTGGRETPPRRRDPRPGVLGSAPYVVPLMRSGGLPDHGRTGALGAVRGLGLGSSEGPLDARAHRQVFLSVNHSAGPHAERTMTQPEDERTFETEIHLAAPRDAVWEAIATDEGLRRWFAPEARFERRVGGEVVWNWADHHRWVQRIEALEPGRRLRTRYDSPVDDGAGGKRPLFIEFLLEGEGGTTTLRVVQSGFGSEAAFDNEYDGIRQGWPVELRSLRLHLERHRGKARQLAWCTRVLEGGAGSDPGAIWDRLMGARGFRCDAPVETLAEGTPLDFTSVDGDRFAGVALRCNARELTADLESHGGAFLRLTVGVWGGRIHVWCWLGAYGRDPRELAALEERWDAMLTRLFGVQSPSQDRVGAGA